MAQTKATTTSLFSETVQITSLIVYFIYIFNKIQNHACLLAGTH